MSLWVRPHMAIIPIVDISIWTSFSRLEFLTSLGNGEKLKRVFFVLVVIVNFYGPDLCCITKIAVCKRLRKHVFIIWSNRGRVVFCKDERERASLEK